MNTLYTIVQFKLVANHVKTVPDQVHTVLNNFCIGFVSAIVNTYYTFSVILSVILSEQQSLVFMYYVAFILYSIQDQHMLTILVHLVIKGSNLCKMVQLIVCCLLGASLSKARFLY